MSYHITAQKNQIYCKAKQSIGLKQVYIFYCTFINDIIYIKLFGISANKGQTI